MAGHVAPEAAVGGPIAAVREGDTIHFDIPNRRLDVEISENRDCGAFEGVEEAGRRSSSAGVFRKYVDTVSSAAPGAVTN